MTTSEVNALKRAIGTQRPLSEGVRARALAYVRARRREGASQDAIARELGLSQHTVSRWLRARNEAAVLADADKVPASALVAVRVVDEPHGAMPAAATPLVVTTPRGLRIEGLGLDALCTLIARLG